MSDEGLHRTEPEERDERRDIDAVIYREERED